MQNTAVKDNQRSPKTARKGLSKEKTRKGEIASIKFKNSQDLAFDYMKFANCNIKLAMLEMHGNNLNQKSSDYMGKFLESVDNIERLHLNLSISSLTKEFVDPIGKGLSSLKALKHLELDLSRSKIEAEAFENLSKAISGSPVLESLTISIEK